MKRPTLIGLLLAILVPALALAGCGGGSSSSSSKSTSSGSKPTLVSTSTTSTGQRSYRVKLPNGKVVTQAHSPTLAETPKTFKLIPSTATSTVEQYDSIFTSTLPPGAHYVAGYVNGHWPTYFSMRGHWPVVVGISVFRNGGADCFDMEPGNPGPDAAGPWAKWQMTQGNSRPCEYSMLSWMPAIKSNLTATGVRVCYLATDDRCVRLWDANWTYAKHLDSGYACTQWTDHSGGVNRDESTCTTWFYHRSTPPPAPRPKPKPKPVPASIFTVFPTSVTHGSWSERRLAESLDGALARKAQYATYISKTLKPEALWFVRRLDEIAYHLNPSPHPNWSPNHDGTRHALLSELYAGRRIG